MVLVGYPGALRSVFRPPGVTLRHSFWFVFLRILNSFVEYYLFRRNYVISIIDFIECAHSSVPWTCIFLPFWLFSLFNVWSVWTFFPSFLVDFFLLLYCFFLCNLLWACLYSLTWGVVIYCVVLNHHPIYKSFEIKCRIFHWFYHFVYLLTFLVMLCWWLLALFAPNCILLTLLRLCV